jgi:hypothetical protein
MEEEKINSICEICKAEITIDKRAVKLCEKCFNEECTCGHIRGKHVDNFGSCIHQKDWRNNNEFCKCIQFVSAEQPIVINKLTVINYSEHWKKIVIEKNQIEKGVQALNFLDKLEYIKKENSETGKGYYLVDKQFKIINEKGLFKCSCNENECSHVLALMLQLKIWNYERRKEKKFQEELKTDLTII